MNIDGATRLYAIIGDPVVQVRSPAVYTAHFAQHDVNAVMVAAQASRESFDTAMRGLMALGNLDGLLITSPHKTAALAFADALSTRAKIVGAINALRREADGSWTGDMFDGVGFVSAAQKISTIEGKRALLFGCGGAGAAIAAELAAHGARSISLVDPDTDRAQALRAALAAQFDGCDVTVDHDGALHDIVINASIVGMKDGDGLPGDPGEVGPRTLVGDVVLRPPATPTALVRFARDAGAQVVTGQEMHGGQLDAISAFFKGAR
ncbi:shikimate dehydrogenase [Paraburkholderia sp. Tr-20389]|uniref:shikimate dehydrogenase family protein n=1 Tax=Paraburkholderia sp. Tr-20389 TaxID=2703903 RepID=UPI00197D5856|nr:shikimate dehydrogenase [Paraburkholderia sp. Tr-20389]MBN3756604.1 shikimate dehydrogenase [Paraburkholderia sp. Tr-20389]